MVAWGRPFSFWPGSELLQLACAQESGGNCGNGDALKAKRDAVSKARRS